MIIVKRSNEHNLLYNDVVFKFEHVTLHRTCYLLCCSILHLFPLVRAVLPDKHSYCGSIPQPDTSRACPQPTCNTAAHKCFEQTLQDILKSYGKVPKVNRTSLVLDTHSSFFIVNHTLAI